MFDFGSRSPILLSSSQSAIGHAPPSALELLGHPMHYAWGRPQKQSAVADLYSAARQPAAPSEGGPGCPYLAKDKDANIFGDPEKPWAELWFGTHPSGPTRCRNLFVHPGRAAKPQQMNSAARCVCGCTAEACSCNVEDCKCCWTTLEKALLGPLPFLLKVLSIGAPLSIQAHPDKARARQLCRQNPSVYKDENHKPEVALALTDFEALCAFRPAEEIHAFVNMFPVLRDLLGPELCSTLDNVIEESASSEMAGTAVRVLFTVLMNSKKEKVLAATEAILSAAGSFSPEVEELLKLIGELNQRYPGDVGTLCPIFMNYLKMKPGDALYIGAGEPHAYLSGECVECMACSDNVVRAGLTPKFIDVPTLVSMLTYKLEKPQLVVPQKKEIAVGELTNYPIPVADFALLDWKIPAQSTKPCPVPYGQRHRVLLCLEGTVTVTIKPFEGEPSGTVNHNKYASFFHLKRGKAMYLAPEAYAAVHTFDEGGRLIIACPGYDGDSDSFELRREVFDYSPVPDYDTDWLL